MGSVGLKWMESFIRLEGIRKEKSEKQGWKGSYI